MDKVRIVLTTVSSDAAAEALAQALVERRLAACVNILGPIRSIYRWQGAVENEPEYLLLVKTTADRTADLSRAFRELHPYELPELVELDVAGGSAAYLCWVIEQVSRGPQ